MKILYQDEYIVAVHKRAGLLVHRTDIARGQTDEFALQQVAKLTNRYIYPLHRLDRPTNGVLLFAFDEESTRTLKTDFTEHRIQKTYQALVRGWLAEAQTIDYPLKKVIFDRRKKRKQTADGVEIEKQSAVTELRPVSRHELPVPVGRYETARYTFVELKPKTGRTHQLRRHMAHLRHPIIGDKRYGDRDHNRMFASNYGCERLFLTAVSLELVHPITKEKLKIETQPDNEICEVSKLITSQSRSC
ncbi:MAG: pseudouridine synthase [Chloroflexota bacterium]